MNAFEFQYPNYRSNTQGQENKKKYGRPPSLEEINMVLKVLKIKDSKLETFFGMPADTMKRIRWCGRTIPRRYWHLFYFVLDDLGFRKKLNTQINN